MIAGFTYFSLLFSFLLPGPSVKNKEHHHPLYIAVAQMDYNNSDAFATLQCKTFSDDLELALEKKYGTKVSVDTPGSKEKLASEIEDYINNHLQVIINGKQVKYVFINFTKEGNTVSMNFRINNIKEINRCEVDDTIFYELYDRQIQIIYITVNGNRKSNRVTNPESKVAFDF
ncbi:MAG: DUF6702 family protein [Ginsengibacter sp.]